MKLNFIYSEKKDVWCLLNKGRNSNNNPNPTESFLKLTEKYGTNPSEDDVKHFIKEYLEELKIDKDEFIDKIRNQFKEVSEKFISIAEKVFEVNSKKYNLTVYPTINNRCPYSIEDNLFFISFVGESQIRTIFHELWHFYTWYRFDDEWIDKIGPQKYNHIKESLTVLINIECNDLLPEGIEDKGYIKHQELRERIKEWWLNNRDIDYVWHKSVEFLG